MEIVRSSCLIHSVYPFPSLSSYCCHKILFNRDFSGIILYENDDVWCCQKCRLNVKKEDVENLVFALQQMIQEICPNLENIETFEEFLSTTENLLHENHFLRVITRRFLSQLYVASSHASPKRDFSRKILNVFQKLDAGLSQTRGLTLVQSI
jgi:hypothetical protein